MKLVHVIRPHVLRRTALAAMTLATAASAQAGSAATSPDAAAYEVDYMKFTMDHHAMGVEMAFVCQDNAVSDRLNDLCVRIEQDQAQEIITLDGYLSDWYGQGYEPVLTEQDVMDLQMLRGLEGRQFDIGISEMFIEHHRMIVDRSEEALARVEHQELLGLAQGIITKQSAEIAEFEAVIAEAGGGTVIPLPAPVALGGLGLAGTAVATWRGRRRSM